METLTEYRISPRVVLRPGDRFKVGRGPYWRTAGGERVPMAVRGTCVLVSVIRQRSRTFLLARSGGEGTVVLHVEGRRRNRLMPQLVCRPYTVRRMKKR
jgi:hypothetical protein